MSKQWKPAPFAVGQKLRYIREGATYTFYRNGENDKDGSVALGCGTIAEVTKVNPGYQAHRHDFGDGMEDVPPHNGWNTLSIQGLPCRAVDCESMKDWEVVS